MSLQPQRASMTRTTSNRMSESRGEEVKGVGRRQAHWSEPVQPVLEGDWPSPAPSGPLSNTHASMGAQSLSLS